MEQDCLDVHARQDGHRVAWRGVGPVVSAVSAIAVVRSGVCGSAGCRARMLGSHAGKIAGKVGDWRGSTVFALVCIVALLLCTGCGVAADEIPTSVVPLVLSGASGVELVLQPEGIELLRGALARSKLYTVVVAGPARKGKSFFLNKLMGLPMNAGFSVGHSVKGHTKGMWLHVANWTGDDDPITLVIDTEGFGAVGNLEAYDPKLCALAAVIAETFLYNVMGTIDMQDVRFLRTVAQFEDIFKTKFNASFPAPPITWLVQNFQLDFEELDPFSRDCEGYLSFAFSEKIVDNESVDGNQLKQLEHHNNVSRYVQSKFPSQSPPRIFCLEHPSPGTKGKVLPRLSDEDLHPTYREQLDSIRLLLKERRKAKNLAGVPMSGKSMADVLRVLVPKLNDLSSVGHDLVSEMAEILATECFRLFSDNVTSIMLPTRHSTLKEDIGRYRGNALEKFDSECVGSSELTENQRPRKRLDKDLLSHQRVTEIDNSRKLLLECTKVANVHFERLQGALDTVPLISHTVAVQLCSNLEETYEDKCSPSQCTSEGDCGLLVPAASHSGHITRFWSKYKEQRQQVLKTQVLTSAVAPYVGLKVLVRVAGASVFQKSRFIMRCISFVRVSMRVWLTCVVFWVINSVDQMGSAVLGMGSIGTGWLYATFCTLLRSGLHTLPPMRTTRVCEGPELRDAYLRMETTMLTVLEGSLNFLKAGFSSVETILAQNNSLWEDVGKVCLALVCVVTAPFLLYCRKRKETKEVRGRGKCQSSETSGRKCESSGENVGKGFGSTVVKRAGQPGTTEAKQATSPATGSPRAPVSAIVQTPGRATASPSSLPLSGLQTPVSTPTGSSVSSASRVAR